MPSRPPAARLALTANLLAKGLLAALVVLYLSAPHWEQFEGKVMPLRATLFPVAAALTWATWRLRGRPGPYPHMVDALITWATVTDFGGNAARFYDIEGFDHLVHFVNTFLLALAVGVAMGGWRVPRLAVAGLTLGVGSVLHTIWEITEFQLDERFDAALDVASQTIIRDFIAGLAGAVLAAALVAWRLHDRPDLGGRLLAPRRSAGP